MFWCLQDLDVLKSWDINYIDIHHMQLIIGETGSFDEKGRMFLAYTNWIFKKEINEEASPGPAIQKLHSSIIKIFLKISETYLSSENYTDAC